MRSISNLLCLAAVLFVLAACQARQPAESLPAAGTAAPAASSTVAAPAVTATSGPQRYVPNAATPTQPATAEREAAAAAGSSVHWDPSPQAKVAVATFCCGLVPEIVRLNALPSGQAWGDGRVIWVEMGDNGSRRVLESRLEVEALEGWLQSASDQGFFGWQELFTRPLSPTDLPSKCLAVTLVGQDRRVCEYYQGAPDEFHALWDALASGLGATGTDYRPEVGYLTAFPASQPAGEAGSLPTWDAQALGVTLAEAGAGTWVKGPALEKAWSLVNVGTATVVIEAGSAYRLALQVPGVSYIEPPAP